MAKDDKKKNSCKDMIKKNSEMVGTKWNKNKEAQQLEISECLVIESSHRRSKKSGAHNITGRKRETEIALTCAKKECRVG